METGETVLVQKDEAAMAAFWNSTAEWRTTYFLDLCARDPATLPVCLRLEREFVLAESEAIRSEMATAEHVVELGCGVGRSLLPAIASEPDKHFIGIDLAATQIARFSAALDSLTGTNARALVADAANLPLPNDSADLVLICNQTIGTFLGAKRHKILVEVGRILRPGGRLFIGGFDRIGVAAACYAEWGVPVEELDVPRQFVQLEHYNSWWQPECGVTAFVARYRFATVVARRAGLGFLNTYLQTA